MYAALIHTNDRSGGNNRYVGNVKADTVDELANKLGDKYPQAQSVVCWMHDHSEVVTHYLAQSPDDTFFCGDSGDLRYDVQVVD